MKTHLLSEGKKPQFIVLEAGDITLTGKDIAGLSRMLGKVSPFADPNDYTSEEDKRWVEILIKLSRFTDAPVQFHLCSNPGVPASILWGIYHSWETLHNGIVDEAIIGLSLNPAAPHELLSKLLEIRDANIDWKIAQNKLTPGFILEQIYNHYTGDLPYLFHNYKDEVLKCIAANPSLPRRLAEKMFAREDSRHDDLDEHLAGNPSLSTDMIKKLHAKNNLATHLGGNPSTPPGILKEIYEKEQQFFAARLAVARNHSTPPDLLRQIYQVQIKINKPNTIENKHAHEILTALAENPSAPEDLIREMYSHKYLQLAIATNPSSPSDILDELYNMDPPFNPRLHEALAKNKNLPHRLMRNLFNKQSQNEDVVLALAKNPSTSPDILSLIHDLNNSSSLEPKIELEEALASNRSTPVYILETYLGQGNIRTIRSLASNRRGSTL